MITDDDILETMQAKINSKTGSNMKYDRANIDTDRIDKLKNKYKRTVIRDNRVDQLLNSSKLAYNEEKAIREGYNVLSSHEDVSAESLKNSLFSHNTDIIFRRIKNKFLEIYDFDVSDLTFVNDRTMGNVNAFFETDLIFFDRMLEDTLHAFFIVTLIWAKYFDDENLYGRFFNYLTTVLYATIVDKSTYNIYDGEYIKREIRQWSSTVNLAVSCQYFCMYFCIAHEVAHKYIAETVDIISAVQEEFKADSIAYDIVLRLMMDEENSDIENKDRELFAYCYLAPMMIFDFWDLLFYTNRVISKTYMIKDNKHPEIKKRKENLFSIPYTDEYDFDSSEGNDVYSAFLDVIDKYKTELLYRAENGTLKEFLNYIKGA